MIKRVLFTVVGAFAALSVGAAGAYFAAQVQVADSVIRAGSVAISTVPTTASYSVFMHGLKNAGITLDRKVLSDMAITDPAAFAKLVELAKTAV